MAKSKPKNRPSERKISIEEALQYLDDIQQLASEIDEPTVSISLRVPANILRSIKLKAKADGKKYQSLMIAYIRRGLRDRSL